MVLPRRRRDAAETPPRRRRAAAATPRSSREFSGLARRSGALPELGRKRLEAALDEAKAPHFLVFAGEGADEGDDEWGPLEMFRRRVDGLFGVHASCSGVAARTAPGMPTGRLVHARRRPCPGDTRNRRRRAKRLKVWDAARGAVARSRRGYFADESRRRRRGCHVDIPWRSTPPPRRGYSVEASRGDAAAKTWVFRSRPAHVLGGPRAPASDRRRALRGHGRGAREVGVRGALCGKSIRVEGTAKVTAQAGPGARRLWAASDGTTGPASQRALNATMAYLAPRSTNFG